MKFTCPRCTTVIDERFYGPCKECVDDLHEWAEMRQEEMLAVAKPHEEIVQESWMHKA